MALYQNGERVASNTPARQLTSQQYDNLSTSEKNNGTVYYVSDADDSVYQKLLYLTDVIGNEDDLADYADGTIAGCIADLFDKLNGLSFSINAAGTPYLQATYVGNNPSTTIPSGTYTTDEEKVNHLLDVLGDESEIAELGYTTVVGAILALYERLANGDLTFTPVLNQGNLQAVNITYDSTTVTLNP